MENPEFLRKKYDLHNSPEVKSAAKKTERQTGESLPNDADLRIQNYLDRLERLALDSEKKQQRTGERKNPPDWLGGKQRPRALSLLREMIMNKYVRQNKEKMAEGAARTEERVAIELGIDAHYGREELEERGEIAVEDLEKSLDQWILYLSDANEPYPTWFRYYAFRNILDLGDYDKEKREFTKRSQGSTRLFPEIDRGALGYIEERIEAAKNPEKLKELRKAQQFLGAPESELLTKEKAANFSKLSFAKQYAEGIQKKGEITEEMKKETDGRWVKYQKGTDPTALWASLQNKGTAWCTKGFATAETQLKGGDFYVYYTLDRQGKPSIPRIAIRMQENNIGEVRGVADNDQNLEGNMAQIAEEKMNDLPGAERYKKASADMKALTLIEKKTKSGEALIKDDLIFLYEINSKIQGFGYQGDPRIKELRDKRRPNIKEDAAIVFECESDQIARKIEDINQNTKAYVGKLQPGIFDLIQKNNIEHIYTSFPEGKIRRETIEIGGKTAKELESELKKEKINISDYAQDMLRSKDFATSKKLEETQLVRLKVSDLGFERGATTEEIYKKAEELGLDLCPAEVGPHYSLKYKDQPLNEWFWIAMKQISDRRRNPSVFSLVRDDDGLWLSSSWAGPADEWDSDDEFVFRFRKSFLSALYCAGFLFLIFQAFHPPPEHFTYFVQFQSNLFILFMRDQFSFPSYGN